MGDILWLDTGDRGTGTVLKPSYQLVSVVFYYSGIRMFSAFLFHNAYTSSIRGCKNILILLVFYCLVISITIPQLHCYPYNLITITVLSAVLIADIPEVTLV